MELRDIAGDGDAVGDVLTPEPAVEARDAAGIMELEEMRRKMARVIQHEYRPGRSSGSGLDWFSPGESVQLIEVFDRGACPRLRVYREEHFVRPQVEIEESRQGVGLKNRYALPGHMDGDQFEGWPVAAGLVLGRSLRPCRKGTV